MGHGKIISRFFKNMLQFLWYSVDSTPIFTFISDYSKADPTHSVQKLWVSQNY